MALFRPGGIQRAVAENRFVFPSARRNPDSILTNPGLRIRGVDGEVRRRPQCFRSPDLPESPGGLHLMTEPFFRPPDWIPLRTASRQQYGKPQCDRLFHGRKNAPSIKQLSCFLSLI